MGPPVVNLRPAETERAANPRKFSEPLSPAAAIAASTRAHSSSFAPDSTISPIDEAAPELPVVHRARRDKASVVLGIQHRKSMEPIPASNRTSIATSRSVPNVSTSHANHVASLPLCSLYVVSGLAKSPHTWQLADTESVMGLRHSEGAVGRFWRAEVLGSTVSPGAGGSTKKKSRKAREIATLGAGALSKQEVAKMLSKTLKLSFPREVEIVASTLQPASTVHTFTYSIPSNTTSSSVPGGAFRSSIFSSTTHNGTMTDLGLRAAYDDPIVPRPSSTFLGPPPSLADALQVKAATAGGSSSSGDKTIYHGVCLTVWSHADEDRSAAIRRSLENAARARKESTNAPSVQSSARKHRSNQALRKKNSGKGSWPGGEGGPPVESDIDPETEGEVDSVYDGVSESDFDGGASQGGPGGSSLFLPGDTVFWLPYALTLVSRHPIYDLMRDYLTLSWARFSKDVQSHSLQIAKILSHPAPRAGEIVRLDATSSKDKEKEGETASLEVICRFPGGLDFGKGLVDVNFTMYPLFQCLALDNILTICEIALAPTGRVLFLSRHPQMLGIAVSTIKYLVELRGWNGVALPMVHTRDAKIYLEDPGPWIIGLGTEARHVVRPSSEVCICDLDINHVACLSPSPGAVSNNQKREKYRKILLNAFDAYFHPDYAIPSEFKEAFPAGRFRPLCKIQAKRGATASIVAESIKPPEWWNQAKVIQAFDTVLQDKVKKPSLFRRVTSFGAVKKMPQLSPAEQLAQITIRRRATAFVDARDDLETKIGRLSRRLNFLMTESDLWKEKFITFESYAEKLSGEAAELRNKINKEQKESKRLSSMITSTASEKIKLEDRLRETEGAHRQAMLELEEMRQNMARMEDERAAMVAEVEAQIERALQSMIISESEPEDPNMVYSPRHSRPSSRRSSVTSASGGRMLRSFGTGSTLAEDREAEEAATAEEESGREYEKEEEYKDGKDGKNKDELEVEPKKLKRFSAPNRDEGMITVDENITERSDKISKKVMEIQAKVGTRLYYERIFFDIHLLA
ncbi:hypothetical protein M422DRAFT_191607 [Sphaerobolus stellatus SS14]|uniref:cDENN domain-containing protein n=1 Tax=Sphaerobolus stellatus (strain SS14) TaxID=990650 RepID=A0A0C9TYM8_SPHS4|nr:hypothetical protein M422DRAFT_191607 [Sphaerobolus stellatus SS14]